MREDRRMNETNFQKYGLEPYGAIPSYRQMERYRGERYAFFHFGMNTFTNAEWGEGDVYKRQVLYRQIYFVEK